MPGSTAVAVLTVVAVTGGSGRGTGATVAVVVGVGAAVPKNAPNKENAMAYLNAMLDPRAQVGFAQSMSYAPTVDNAAVPEPLMKEIGFTAAEQANMKYPDFEYLAKNNAALLDFWNKEFKA